MFHRKRGQVEQVRCYAAQALQIAISSELPSYIATAHANHAWLAWREKKYKEARTEAEAALGLWPSTYPFQWTAIFPLIARLVRRNQIEQAIRHARVLCQPLQQKLPDALTRNLEQAIRAWDQKQAPAAREHLQRALESGEPEGYV